MLTTGAHYFKGPSLWERLELQMAEAGQQFLLQHSSQDLHVTKIRDHWLRLHLFNFINSIMFVVIRLNKKRRDVIWGDVIWCDVIVYYKKCVQRHSYTELS